MNEGMVSVQHGPRWPLYGLAGSALVGFLFAAIDGPVLIAAATAGFMLVFAASANPLWGYSIWIAVTVLVPVWTPISLVGISLQPATLVGAPVLLGVLLSKNRNRIRVVLADFFLVAMGLLTLLWVRFDEYPSYVAFNVISVLVLAYCMGRLAPEQVKSVYLVAMLFAASWGILEFLFDFHVWLDWYPEGEQSWNMIQSRAGVSRSEASFGHAIAYGACLVMAMPQAARMAKGRLLAEFLLVAGVLTSLSRGPISALVFTAVICGVIEYRNRKNARGIGFILAVGTIAIAGFQFIYGGSDSQATETSGDARSVQLAASLPHLRPFGSGILPKEGMTQLLGVTIIDNTFLRFCVNYGWIGALAILSPLLLVLFRLIRGKGNAASEAVVGQLPVLVVASLITQWQAFFFFMLGVAVSETISDGRIGTSLRRQRKNSP